MTTSENDMPFHERRLSLRFKNEVGAWLKIRNSKTHPGYLKFRTANLSKAGCMIKLNALPKQLRWQVSMELDMVLIVPLEAGKVIRVYHMDAFVRHIQPNGDTGFIFRRKEPKYL